VIPLVGDQSQTVCPTPPGGVGKNLLYSTTCGILLAANSSFHRGYRQIRLSKGVSGSALKIQAPDVPEPALCPVSSIDVGLELLRHAIVLDWRWVWRIRG
jgi:hypothetical protein